MAKEEKRLEVSLQENRERLEDVTVKYFSITEEGYKFLKKENEYFNLFSDIRILTEEEKKAGRKVIFINHKELVAFLEILKGIREKEGGLKMRPASEFGGLDSYEEKKYKGLIIQRINNGITVRDKYSPVGVASYNAYDNYNRAIKDIDNGEVIERFYTPDDWYKDENGKKVYPYQQWKKDKEKENEEKQKKNPQWETSLIKKVIGENFGIFEKLIDDRISKYDFRREMKRMNYNAMEIISIEQFVDKLDSLEKNILKFSPVEKNIVRFMKDGEIKKKYDDYHKRRKEAVAGKKNNNKKDIER